MRWTHCVIGTVLAAWPVQSTGGAAQPMSSQSSAPQAAPLASRSLDDFQLPAKSIFDRSMPRYPNAWFYIERSLAPTYDEAVKLVTNRLRTAMRLREFFGPFDNPEGCDFETRLEHLQPWESSNARALQHAHAFHMRYYYSALAKQQASQVELNTASGKQPFYRFAASVHYEVEHSNPNHADVESCPICGRTGDYQRLTGNLVEMVHDPLGLELLLTGTIRGEVVRFEDASQDPVGSVAALANVAVQSFVFDGLRADRNTLRIGIVAITRR